MRVLRYLTLLSIAVTAFAADEPTQLPKFDLRPNFEWKSPVRGPDGNYQFRSLPSRKIPREVVEEYLGRTGCYFIRSYVMHHDDDTEAMHLEKVTTCTPGSRFQMKKTVRIVPAAR